MKYRNLPAGVTQRRAQANGIFLDYLESGTPGSPLIVLLHGWPETCWSWRHQLKPLADAGYHVIAPDQRGYGGSTVPRTPEAYAGDILAADVLALVDHVKNQTGGKAIFVGHDWGALLLWHLARLHPERVEAAIIVSVPLFDPPVPPIAQFKKIHEDRFFYILHFQQVGPAEVDLDRDPYRSLSRIYYTASGDADHPLGLATTLPAHGTTITQSFLDAPAKFPAWCSDSDFENYVNAFKESGFFGGVSWYRNFDVNWHVARTLPVSRLTMPVFFIGGSKDPVIRNVDKKAIDGAHSKIPGYKGSKLIENSGHWTQQETPREFNEALLRFLGDLKGIPKSGGAKM